MKGKIFAERMLVFQEKSGASGAEQMGECREKTDVRIEIYSHTPEEVNEAHEKIDGALRSLGEYEEATVVLKSVADREPFDFFYNAVQKKPCVILDKKGEFKKDFQYALERLRAYNCFPTILGETHAKQLEKSLGKQGIEGIWDLPIDAQQKIMKHAQAYLLAESIVLPLKAKLTGKKNIKVKVVTKWETAKEGKPHTDIGLEYKKATTGLSKEEEARLKSYADFYSEQAERHRNDENLFNRTFPHRLEDHEFAMEAIMDPDGGHRDIKRVMPKLDSERPVLRDLHALLFPTDQYKPFFIDIGPGIANEDTIVMDGNGTPAVTSIEMAERFPDMPVTVLDLPESVAIFLGKEEGHDRYGRKYKITEAKRNKLMRHSNIHIVSGNGLESLKDQWEDESTNPEKYRLRKRPQIDKNATIFIRTANAIDIYCEWDKENYGAPSIHNALLRMAKDFKENPVMLFFNKEILFKPQGSTKWTVIGQLSNRGFEHNSRRPSRKGQPPFQFDEKAIKGIER